ncbi:GTP 3',8-cyclase MoaA [Anaerocolumna sp.]|uniref:GTP 3',8-cyclase MoaA n=1 Tax=Anaerocolumna sp. TaxID=2041569 RepID=UPI0028B234CB|nr:GTP 3',8-cyclase MoaA [Anaerocolumna sp.]
MVDNYNRVIDYIRISITDRCNLRCIYCMPKEGMEFIPHENILTYEEIIRLCKCFASLGMSKVKLTGGEPLVRKNLSYLVKEIKNISGIQNVTLTTNGILLAEQIEDLVQAGIDAVNVSLDTLDPDQFEQLTRFRKLDQVLEGIEETLKYTDIALKINCVPLREDYNNILSMVSLAKNQKLHVRFIEVMPIGLGKDLKGLTEENIKEIIEKEYGTLTPYKTSIGNGPCHYYSLEGFQGKIGFISAISHQFCDSCNRVRLTSEGYLKNCLQYANGIDLKSLMRQGISDEELIGAIREAISHKPKEHHFNEVVNKEKDNLSNIQNDISKNIDQELESRRMSQIGG